VQRVPAQFIVVGRDPSGRAVIHDESRTAGVRNHRGHARCQRFLNYVSKRVRARRKHKDIHVAVRARQRLAGQHAGKRGVGNRLLQPFPFAPAAHDGEPHLAHPFPMQIVRQPRQEPHVLLRLQSAGITHHDVRIAPVPPAWVEQLRVDAPRHREHRFSGSSPQHFDQAGVGSEDQVSAAEEPHHAVQDKPLNGGRRSLRSACGKPSHRLGGPPRGEFMQVGMPGERQGHAQPCCGNRAQNPQVARTCQMYDIRRKREQRPFHRGQMAVEQRIETQVSVHREGQSAARDLHSVRRLSEATARRLAAARHEPGKPLAPGISVPFAAGPGGAIYLVKCVCEQGDSRYPLHFTSVAYQQRAPSAVTPI